MFRSTGWSVRISTSTEDDIVRLVQRSDEPLAEYDRISLSSDLGLGCCAELVEGGRQLGVELLDGLGSEPTLDQDLAVARLVAGDGAIELRAGYEEIDIAAFLVPSERAALRGDVGDRA